MLFCCKDWALDAQWFTIMSFMLWYTSPKLAKQIE